jgi:hypothetical protein
MTPEPDALWQARRLATPIPGLPLTVDSSYSANLPAEKNQRLIDFPFHE